MLDVEFINASGFYRLGKEAIIKLLIVSCMNDNTREKVVSVVVARVLNGLSVRAK